MYNITENQNLKKIKDLEITKLHPEKHTLFLKMMSTLKQEHYKANWLKKQVYKTLIKPKTTKSLSKKFKRSFARIEDILMELKKEKLIMNYRVGSKSYWIKNNQQTVIISKQKEKVLKALNENKTTTEVSKTIKRDFNTAKKHLVNLERLGLVKRGNKWQKLKTKIKIITL